MKTLVYLASPYSHPDPAVRLQRFHEACRKAADLMHHGFLVFSPIAHSHSIAVGWGLPLGWEYWEDFDLRLISTCDEMIVLMLPGWQDSVGVTQEIGIAANLGKPIHYHNL
jgi:hypothetical protein